jgi:hypothetical protein
LNIRPQSHFSLSNRGDSGQTSRERFTVLDRDLIEQLDATIDRLNFRGDILDEPTITRPLPDKVTKREFLTTKRQEDYIFFDDDFSAFDPFHTPVTQKETDPDLYDLIYGKSTEELLYNHLLTCPLCHVEAAQYCLYGDELGKQYDVLLLNSEHSQERRTALVMQVDRANITGNKRYIPFKPAPF